MTEERDPQLTSLFAAAEEKLEERDFVSAVMTGVEKQARWALVRRIGVAAALVLCAMILAAPAQDAVAAVMHWLMVPLIRFEQPLPSQILLPLNNVAAALFLALVVLRLLRRRLFP
ncbi:hypothetical protein [Hoeflea poritis]|uniref:Uncharacterized protein n=1 Tax=Hoeflea poritis TaxID=2993659 RepID=A0ABT4VMR4_9HYPH|nr:hypothetical protein [Hoeflea poritis]MDA4845998.1 hypothetical protein [Hoeflea poritis]